MGMMLNRQRNSIENQVKQCEERLAKRKEQLARYTKQGDKDMIRRYEDKVEAAENSLKATKAQKAPAKEAPKKEAPKAEAKEAPKKEVKKAEPKSKKK